MYHDVRELIQWLQRRRHNAKALVIAALLAAFWGLRATEITSLTLGDVLFGQTVVCVVRGKFSKLRQVPSVFVPDWVIEMLEIWWVQRSSAVHGDLSANLLGLNTRTLELHLGNGLKQRRPVTQYIQIEMPDSVHHLRHWFANRLFLKCLPISEIARLLGHASPRTTVRSYLHVVQPFAQSITRIDQNSSLLRPVPLKTLARIMALTVRQTRNVLAKSGIKSQDGFVTFRDIRGLVAEMLVRQQKDV